MLQELGAIPPDGDLAGDHHRRVRLAGGGPLRHRDRGVAGAGDSPRRGLGADELITLAHELEHALADQALGILDRLGEPEAGRPRARLRRGGRGRRDAGDGALRARLRGPHRPARAGRERPGRGSSSRRCPTTSSARSCSPTWRACASSATAGRGRLEGRRPRCTRSRRRRPTRSSSPSATGGRAGPGPAPPSRPGAGWTSVTRRELGAAELEWLFHAPGGDPAAALPSRARLVAGWAGGELELWRRRRRAGAGDLAARAARHRRPVRRDRRLVSRRLARGDGRRRARARSS